MNQLYINALRKIAESTKMTISVFFLLTCTLYIKAQEPADSVFRGYLHNKEFDVYMRINFYEKDVIITWQDIYGPLPGFLSKEGSDFCWVVTDVTIDGNKSTLEMVNDYGSEDLTATLTCENDSVYTLQQQSGSNLKVINKNKWQKLPRTLTFLRSRKR